MGFGMFHFCFTGVKFWDLVVMWDLVEAEVV